jgi:hypothetical protein
MNGKAMKKKTNQSSLPLTLKAVMKAVVYLESTLQRVVHAQSYQKKFLQGSSKKSTTSKKAKIDQQSGIIKTE